MGRLAIATEELMGASAPAPQGGVGMPAPAGMNKPNIRLKGQGQPGGQPTNPQQAQAGLGAAVQGLGAAVQGSIDANANDQNRMNGDPNQQMQAAQPQPANGTPQARMRQQQDQKMLKQGKLPQDLDNDVAAVAVNAARQATGTPPQPGQPQRPMMNGQPKRPMQPQQRQPGQMESVSEAEGTFKKTHEFVTKDGNHAYRAGKNTSAGTWDHRHYVKGANGAWKHEKDHGYDGHDSKEDAAAAAKGDRDEHDSKSVTEGAKSKANAFKPDGTVSNPDDKAGYDDMLDSVKSATAKHKSQIKGDGRPISHMSKDGAGRSKGWKVLTSADNLKSKTTATEGEEVSDWASARKIGKQAMDEFKKKFKKPAAKDEKPKDEKPKDEKKVAETILTTDERETLLDGIFGE